MDQRFRCSFTKQLLCWPFCFQKVSTIIIKFYSTSICTQPCCHILCTILLALLPWKNICYCCFYLDCSFHLILSRARADTHTCSQYYWGEPSAVHVGKTYMLCYLCPCIPGICLVNLWYYILLRVLSSVLWSFGNVIIQFCFVLFLLASDSHCCCFTSLPSDHS